jgi:hypothetical protein
MIIKSLINREENVLGTPMCATLTDVCCPSLVGIHLVQTVFPHLCEVCESINQQHLIAICNS